MNMINLKRQIALFTGFIIAGLCAAVYLSAMVIMDGREITLHTLIWPIAIVFITLARKPQPSKAGDEGCPERSGGRIVVASAHRNHGL